MKNLEDYIKQAEEAQNAKNEQMEAASRGSSGESNFIKLKKNHSYRFRILLNTKSAGNTWADWLEYGFESVVPGKGYIALGRSPADLKQNDIVQEIHWSYHNECKARGDADGVKRSHQLFPKRKQAVRVYVVDTDDPDMVDYIGKVYPKPLVYSVRIDREGNILSQIYSVIYNATNKAGKNYTKLSRRVFDLSDTGVDLTIDVKDKGGWNDYDVSFDPLSDPLKLSASKITAVLAEAAELDLEALIPEVNTTTKLKELINVHFFGSEASFEEEDTDDIPMGDGDSLVSSSGEDVDEDEFLKDLD